MFLPITIAQPRTIAHTEITSALTIPPSTAFVNLLQLTALNMHQVRTRLTFTAGLSLSGTTLTQRLASFRFLQDAVAGSPLMGQDINLPATAAEIQQNLAVAMSVIIVPTLAVHSFQVQWQTSANATATIDGSDKSHGGGMFVVEELDSLDSGDAPIAGDCFFACVTANDPAVLASLIRQNFAFIAADFPDAQLVDLSIAGGGAGNVFQATIFYRTPEESDVFAYPLVSAQSVFMAFGTDPNNNAGALNRFLLANAAATLNVWATGCAGDGAIWCECLIYEPGAGPGPGLLGDRILPAQTRLTAALKASAKPTGIQKTAVVVPATKRRTVTNVKKG